MWELTTVYLLCVYVTISNAYSFCSTNNDIVRAMEKADIGKDVSPGLPSKQLEVSFYESSLLVDLGNELKPKELNETPTVDWDGADENKKYTLVLVDPDVPSSKIDNVGEFLHWLVVNIPSNRAFEGEELVEYIPPVPQQGTGLHRYVFLAYEQEDGMNDFSNITRINKTTVAGRDDFSITLFALLHNLIVLPTAGNFFVAQYDDSVPIMQKQLGIKPEFVFSEK